MNLRAWVGLRGLKPLLRLELRELLRHRTRSLLILILIALPVAAMAGGATILAITTRTLEEQAASELGASDARVDLDRAKDFDALRKSLPAAAEIEPIVLASESWPWRGRILPVRVVKAKATTYATDGIAHGLVRITAGSAPQSRDEIALSPRLLEALEVAVGERVSIEGRELTVCGSAVEPEDLDARLALRSLEPDAEPRTCLVRLRDLRAEELRVTWFALGYVPRFRSDIKAGDEFESAVVLLGGGFGLAEAALIIAAAFAVSLRRRQRELGLLGALGATPRQLLLALLCSTALLAMIAAVIGIVVGVLAAALVHPWLDSWNQRWNGAFEVPLAALFTALCFAILASLVAVLIPARVAARLPICVALGAARGTTKPSLRVLVCGITLFASGTIAVSYFRQRAASDGAIFALASSIVAVIGLACCTPAMLLLLGRVASRMPLRWRLAVRDAGRFPVRHAAVVGAVFAALSLTVMLSVVIGSVQARTQHLLQERLQQLRTLPPHQIAFRGPQAMEAAQIFARERKAAAPTAIAFLEARVHIVGSEASSISGPKSGWLVGLSTPELLDVLELPDRSGWNKDEALFLVSDHEALADSVERLALEFVTPEGRRQPFERVRCIRVPWWPVHMPACLLPVRIADEIGLQGDLEPTHQAALVDLPYPLNYEDLHAAWASANERRLQLSYAMELPPEDSLSFFYFLLAACLLTCVILVLSSTALSTVEAAADTRVLHEVGASASDLRGMAGARAAYLALLGCMLAIPAGLNPALAILSLAHIELEFSWSRLPEFLVMAICLPVLCYGGAALLVSRQNLLRHAEAIRRSG